MKPVSGVPDHLDVSNAARNGAIMSTPTTSDDALGTGLLLLAAGIPLSLLLDLATGPQSSEVFDSEPADSGWLAGLTGLLAS